MISKNVLQSYSFFAKPSLWNVSFISNFVTFPHFLSHIIAHTPFYHYKCRCHALDEPPLDPEGCSTCHFPMDVGQ